MKPKFLEIIKLGVLVAMVELAVAVILHGPGDAQHVLHSMNGDGVEGFFTTGFLLLKWFAYGVVLTVFACAACLILKAMGVLTTIAEKFIGGIAWSVSGIRQAWSPLPVPLDTPVQRLKGGKVITLKQVLGALNDRVRKLETLTAGLEPPPPPKSADELLAEKDAQMAEMMAELKALRDAQNRKTIDQPVAPAKKTEAK